MTVSTVRDSVVNAERFVRRNCSQGVDHMIVLPDADQPELLAALEDDPRVTVVATARSWWRPGE